MLENHTTRWTDEELTFLVESWDGSRETTAAVAELLGRTVDACQQRYYEWTWGKATSLKVKSVPETTVEPRSISTRRYQTEDTELAICPTCWLALPATGVCDDCS